MKTNFFYLLMLITIISITVKAQTPCVECDTYSSTDGTYATALGKSTSASGNYSFAAGTGSVAEGIASFSAGTYTTAFGNSSISLGTWNFSEGIFSITIGSYCKTTVNDAIVIGQGLSENDYLTNPNSSSLLIGFNSNKPTFYVSRSAGSGRTGKIAIGNVNLAQPLAKLHIKADEGEVAAILIEPNTWGNGAQAHLSVGNLENGITVQKGSESTDLFFRSQGNYLFSNGGKVGINTLDPQYSLDVKGSMFAKSFRLYNDALPPLGEGFVLVADEFGNAYWNDPTSVSLWQLNDNDIYYMEGKVGIGIEAPEEMLDVAGNVLVDDAIIGREAGARQWTDPFFLTLKGSKNEFASKLMLCKGDDQANHNEIKIINPMLDGVVQFHVGGKINFVVRTSEAVFGAHSGKDYLLKVNGKILSNEIEVLVDEWYDNVFEKNYHLMPISSLEKFLGEYKHLPDLPSGKDVLENGIELGEMNALLLKKIEELTLYTIHQQKMMEKQLKMIENQQQQIDELKQYVND